MGRKTSSDLNSTGTSVCLNVCVCVCVVRVFVCVCLCGRRGHDGDMPPPSM